MLARDVHERIGAVPDAVVLGLPRGGVPVGLEVARTLRAALDVCVVRKLGVPGEEEFALGAIAPGGVEVLQQNVVTELGLTPFDVAAVADREMAELVRREETYRSGRAPLKLRGKTVVLVDDGLATGCSMRAAIAAVKLHHPQRIIVAVPVGAPDTCEQIAREVDDVICPLQPVPFRAVGQWYRNFSQTSDRHVQECLGVAARGWN